MKPKVQWRCLKTDPPKSGFHCKYWFSKCETGDVVEWSTSLPQAELLEAYTHWAPYEAPEPPPKPTPFEAWWNGLRDSELAMGGKVIQELTICDMPAKACFLAGYEAAAKNMAGGGK